MEPAGPGGLREPEQGDHGRPDRAGGQRLRWEHTGEGLPAVPGAGSGCSRKERRERTGNGRSPGGRIRQQLRRQCGQAEPGSGAGRHCKCGARPAQQGPDRIPERTERPAGRAFRDGDHRGAGPLGLREQPGKLQQPAEFSAQSERPGPERERQLLEQRVERGQDGGQCGDDRL